MSLKDWLPIIAVPVAVAVCVVLSFLRSDMTALQSFLVFLGVGLCCVLHASLSAYMKSRLPDISMQHALQTCVGLLQAWAQAQPKSHLPGPAERKANHMMM